jgi:UDP-N-acetylmuramyl pentapeptide phosphotransferase/UDP-N-acetylglucosamine-1-phosphate transferase
MIGQYTKTLVALFLTLATALQGYLDDASITPDEWKALGSLALATVAVWLFPNVAKSTDPLPPPQPQPVSSAPETVTMRPTTQDWQ